MTKINVYGIRGFPFVQGGVEKHCEELYPKIASADMEFKIYRRTPYVKKLKKDNKTNIRYPHIEFCDVWTIKNKYLEALIHSFLCAFKSIFTRPDIVHIHNIGPASTLPIIKLFRIKSVVTLHSMNYKHAKWNRLGKFLLKMSEKMIFRFADKIIFVANPYMQYAINEGGLKKDKAILIPNGLTDFAKLHSSISLSDYNLKKEKYILFVGRLVPEKRIQDLILAFSKIDTDMKLVIVGSHDNNDTYFNELSKFKAQLKDRLIFTGFLDTKDNQTLYKDAYCFVLPSENEGMPIVLLEAMSFGKCSLVSDIEENLDVIKDFGYSFKVRDVKDLQKKLDYMLAHKAEIDKKGKEGMKFVQANYNWETIAKQTSKAYEDILESKNKKKENKNKRTNKKIK
jgi:glycosyltransferase involved in cell wall biosynthesis